MTALHWLTKQQAFLDCSVEQYSGAEQGVLVSPDIHESIIVDVYNDGEPVLLIDSATPIGLKIGQTLVEAHASPKLNAETLAIPMGADELFENASRVVFVPKTNPWQVSFDPGASDAS
jgi:alpha-D-ribose 1-methylphosphonate 5-triphosphate synthase subunit PhnH